MKRKGITQSDGWVVASKKRRKRWIFYTACFSLYYVVLVSIRLDRVSDGELKD